MTAPAARGERSPRAPRPAVHRLCARSLRHELRRLLRPPVRVEAVRPEVLSLLALYDPRLAAHSARVAQAMGALASLLGAAPPAETTGLADLCRGDRPSGAAALAGILPGDLPPGVAERAGLRRGDRPTGTDVRADAGLGDLPFELALLGGLLHDVGKLLVPHDLLFAPRLYTPEEMALVRRHPVLGLAILPAGLDRRILDAVVHHHERWDGAGYPLGLAGIRIPAVARLLAIVDAYDAMTRPRSYRPILTLDQAREELAREAGSQLDPRLVPAFLDWLTTTSRKTPRP